MEGRGVRGGTERCRGQSTLEYILILAAVLAAIVAASTTFGTKAQSTVNKSGEVIDSAAGKLKSGLGL